MDGPATFIVEKRVVSIGFLCCEHGTPRFLEVGWYRILGATRPRLTRRRCEEVGLKGVEGAKPTTATTAPATTTATTIAPVSTSAPTANTVKKVDKKVKLGFIALTDCGPLVMAKELGYFQQRGLDVSLEKQASWPHGSV